MSAIGTSAVGMPQMIDPRMMNPQMIDPRLDAAGSVVVTPGTSAVTAAPAASSMQAPPQLGLPTSAQATAILAAEGVKPPSKIGTILKNLMGSTVAGAALGAGVGFIPFLPGGPVTGAIVGAGLGAVIGLVRGISKSRHDKLQLAANVRDQRISQLIDFQNQARVATQKKKKAAAAKKKKSVAQAVASAHAAKPKKSKTHTVKAGDTLSAIAHREHTTWGKIYAANKKKIGKNPGLIHIGTKLVIPR